LVFTNFSFVTTEDEGLHILVARGAIVTFIHMCTIYLNQIHPLHHSLSSTVLCRAISTGFTVLVSYTYSKFRKDIKALKSFMQNLSWEFETLDLPLPLSLVHLGATRQF
jgi:hypothetical protein